jgi:hypothetical protein
MNPNHTNHGATGCKRHEDGGFAKEAFQKSVAPPSFMKFAGTMARTKEETPGITGGLSKYEDSKLWSIKGYVMRMPFDALKVKTNECGDDPATRLDNDMGEMRFILTVTHVKSYWKARADEKQLASHGVDLTAGSSGDDSGDDLVSGPPRKKTKRCCF